MCIACVYIEIQDMHYVFTRDTCMHIQLGMYGDRDLVHRLTWGLCQCLWGTCLLSSCKCPIVAIIIELGHALQKMVFC